MGRENNAGGENVGFIEDVSYNEANKHLRDFCLLVQKQLNVKTQVSSHQSWFYFQSCELENQESCRVVETLLEFCSATPTCNPQNADIQLTQTKVPGHLSVAKP